MSGLASWARRVIASSHVGFDPAREAAVVYADVDGDLAVVGDCGDQSFGGQVRLVVPAGSTSDFVVVSGVVRDLEGRDPSLAAASEAIDRHGACLRARRQMFRYRIGVLQPSDVLAVRAGTAGRVGVDSYRAACSTMTPASEPLEPAVRGEAHRLLDRFEDPLAAYLDTEQALQPAVQIAFGIGLDRSRE